MKLTDVIKNLDNTIQGKEILLFKMQGGIINQFVQLNIDELKKIREDLLKVQNGQETS